MHKRKDRPEAGSAMARAKRAKTRKTEEDAGEEALLREAFSYLTRVKETFAEAPQVYHEFTALLKEFKDKRVAIGSVVAEVQKLFVGHEELLAGFKVFLPPAYRVPYAEEVQRHKARLAANAERERAASGSRPTPLHLLAAVSNNPEVLQNHSLSYGLPPGMTHFNSIDSYFATHSHGLMGLNPVVTMDRIGPHIAALCPFSSPHVVTFFNMKIASVLQILEAIHRAFEFFPLPTDYTAYKKYVKPKQAKHLRRCKEGKLKKVDPNSAEAISGSHSAVAGVATRAKAALVSPPAYALAARTACSTSKKQKYPMIEGMLDVTDPNAGASQTRAFRRRRDPTAAYIICDYFWKWHESESEEESLARLSAKNKRRPLEDRRSKMRMRQALLSNPRENAKHMEKCQKYSKKYRRPTPEQAMALFCKVKERCAANTRKYKALMRHLFNYFVNEVDVSKTYLLIMKAFAGSKDLQDLFKPFFPGLEGIGETGVPAEADKPEPEPVEPAKDEPRRPRTRKRTPFSRHWQEDDLPDDDDDDEDAEIEQEIVAEQRSRRSTRSSRRGPDDLTSPTQRHDASPFADVDGAQAHSRAHNLRQRRSPVPPSPTAPKSGGSRGERVTRSAARSRSPQPELFQGDMGRQPPAPAAVPAAAPAATAAAPSAASRAPGPAPVRAPAPPASPPPAPVPSPAVKQEPVTITAEREEKKPAVRPEAPAAPGPPPLPEEPRKDVKPLKECEASQTIAALEVKIGQARVFLDQINQLDSILAATLRPAPPPTSKRSKSSRSRVGPIAVKVEQDMEDEDIASPTSAAGKLWEAVKDTCKSTLEHVFTNEETETALKKISEGSREACQQTTIAVIKQLKRWELEKQELMRRSRD